MVLTDEEESDDPAVNFIRKHQGIINDLFSTGMLQQKNVQYNCDGLRGTAEVHRKDGEVRLVRNAPSPIVSIIKTVNLFTSFPKRFVGNSTVRPRRTKTEMKFPESSIT